MKLSIIIPVYNEEKLVIQVIEKLLLLKLPEFITQSEIIIVDDYSSDNTTQVISKFIKDKQAIKLLKHDTNKGKGAAVRTGITASEGEIIIIQDADLELLPDDIPLMINTMQSLNVEFINGSRYMPGIIRPLYSYRRYYFNKLFTRLASVLINVRLTDLACGYKLFTRNIYNQISLKENRFGFEAELLIKVARLKKHLLPKYRYIIFPEMSEMAKKSEILTASEYFGQ